jgi:vWA domain found in the FtsH ternary systems/N-terminal helical region fused to the FtsH ternary system vWA domain
VINELRSAADVTTWLAAGLQLRRIADDDERPNHAIVACANELPTLPPSGVIADIASLLAGARIPMATPPPGDDALRAAVRAYDDDVLARLVATPRFDDVLAAFAHLAPGDRPLAVALVVGSICRRAGFTGAAVSPGALRRALARPREERDAIGRAELVGERAEDDGKPRLAAGAIAGDLADAYLRLARGARQTRALVDDRDLFAIDHLHVLHDLGGRMTADHIATAADELARTLPRRVPANREQRGIRDTNLADDSLYPAGGFAAITPGGANASIENLVTSELVYMEDGPGPDVFTLRYVEGELLYYTRDDSVHRRHRHLIAIALGPDLDDARVKDRDLPWQRLVLALGLVVATVRWLAEQLGDQALTVRLAFSPKILVEEKQIVSLLLSGEVARGIVNVVEEPWASTVEAAASAGGAALADLVVVSLGPTPDLPRHLRAIHVNIVDAAPKVGELAPRRALDVEAPDHDAWTEWCEGAEDLLRWLV